MHQAVFGRKLVWLRRPPQPPRRLCRRALPADGGARGRGLSFVRPIHRSGAIRAAAPRTWNRAEAEQRRAASHKQRLAVPAFRVPRRRRRGRTRPRLPGRVGRGAPRRSAGPRASASARIRRVGHPASNTLVPSPNTLTLGRALMARRR